MEEPSFLGFVYATGSPGLDDSSTDTRGGAPHRAGVETTHMREWRRILDTDQCGGAIAGLNGHTV